MNGRIIKLSFVIIIRQTILLRCDLKLYRAIIYKRMGRSPTPCTAHRTLQYPQPHPEVMITNTIDNKLPQRVTHSKPHECEMHGRVVRSAPACQGLVYLSHTPRTPGYNKHHAHHTIHHVQLRTRVRLWTLLVDGFLLAVFTGEKVEVDDGEGDNRGYDDQETAGDEVGLLQVPVDDTHVGFRVVFGTCHAE